MYLPKVQLQKRTTKMDQADTSFVVVVSVHLTPRFPHNSMDVIVRENSVL